MVGPNVTLKQSKGAPRISDMRKSIFALAVMVAAGSFGQSTCSLEGLKKTAYAEVAHKLGLDSALTLEQFSALPQEQKSNKLLDMTDGMAFVGSLDVNGYSECVELFRSTTATASKLYGQKEVLKSNIRAGKVEPFLDPDGMDAALRSGTATIDVVWKYDVGVMQQLAISLKCDNDSYYYVMTVKNSLSCGAQ